MCFRACAAFFTHPSLLVLLSCSSAPSVTWGLLCSLYVLTTPQHITHTMSRTPQAPQRSRLNVPRFFSANTTHRTTTMTSWRALNRISAPLRPMRVPEGTQYGVVLPNVIFRMLNPGRATAKNEVCGHAHTHIAVPGCGLYLRGMGCACVCVENHLVSGT